MKKQLSKDGSIHVTDEFYNTLISGLGALFATLSVILLISQARYLHGPRHIIGFFIYGMTLITMFTTSALHHGVNGSDRTNHLLRQFDYFAIFVMIAGTFTPFCLILLQNSFGWSFLGIIWTLAVLGIGLKALFPHIPKWITLSIYIAMGWMGALLSKPVYLAISWKGLAWIFLGGVFFTVGGLIYGLEKPNPVPGRFGFHEIWHLFVFAGAASHFAVMYFFLLPYS